MTRAIVIKTYGDGQIASAIADGMTRKIIPLNNEEYDHLRAELARLRAKNDIRAYGDEKRFQSASEALAVKYSTRQHGRVYEAVLGVWGLAWLTIDRVYRELSRMNREG